LPYCQNVHPVRHPEHAVAGVDDGGRVAGPVLPPVRARVDDRPDAEPQGHAIEPREDPLGDLCLREPTGALDVEDREQVARCELSDVDEVVGLDHRVVRGVVRPREVVGPEHDTGQGGARLVGRVRRIDEGPALGGLGEREPRAGGRDQ